MARLLIVLAALGLWLHRRFGVAPPPLLLCREIASGLIILLIVCAVLCRPLARLCWALLCFPLCAVVVLNSLFYDGPRIMVRQLVGPRPPCLEAGMALACELGLFMSLAQSAVLLIRTHGLF
jgi:hypothetical protein